MAKRTFAVCHRMAIAAALSLCQICAASAPAFASSTPAEKVAAIVEPQLARHPHLDLGVAVGVVEPGSNGAVTTSIFYFGRLTDRNNNPIPLNGTTEFEIGSVTKTFTATVLASLVQRMPSLPGVATNRIFPQTPTYKEQQTTIGSLANYTSGLPDTNRGRGSVSCNFAGGTIKDCYTLDLMFENLSSTPTFPRCSSRPAQSFSIPTWASPFWHSPNLSLAVWRPPMRRY